MARLAEIIGIIVLALVFFGVVVWWTSRPTKRPMPINPLSDEEWEALMEKHKAKMSSDDIDRQGNSL